MTLEAWCQGSQIVGHKADVPKVRSTTQAGQSFWQESDEIERHTEAFGIHPVRAVLVETTDEARGKRLMELVNHPLGAGSAKRAGLFWFTISPLFKDPADGSSVPRYLNQPELVLDPIWALPDQSMHTLCDAENATAPQAHTRAN